MKLKKRTIYIYRCAKCGKFTRTTVTMRGWLCDCGGKLRFISKEVSHE